MPLYNTLSASQRAQLLDAAGEDRITLSFYRYHGLPDPKALRDKLFCDWEAMDVLGRIYVAREGINAQLSLPAKRMPEFHAYLEALPFLAGVRLNFAVEQAIHSFLKLKIKVREKIVADGIDDPDFDAARIGRHLKASEFNALATLPDTVLVDMRNHFESEIGHFQGALLPDVETFREALASVAAQLRPQPDAQNLVLYCTGGIRCEKASAYLLHRGFTRVFQLEGGIIEYLRQVKAEGLENKFQGKNFVFDHRMAERISDHVVSSCHLCDAPWDTHRNCGNKACNILFLQCPDCAKALNGCCSSECQAIAALPHAKQKQMRRGNSASALYFKRPKQKKTDIEPNQAEYLPQMA